MLTMRYGVIVGDVPPAYMDIETCKTGADAVEGYIYCMGEWVAAVKASEPIDELIPVLTQGGKASIEPTVEHAEMLGSRMDFIERELLPYFQ